MYRFTSFLGTVLFLALFSITFGCSSSDIPNLTSSGNDTAREPVLSDSGRVLWGLYDLQIDADHKNIEVIPKRDLDFHANVRRFLENSPCVQCLQITKILPGNEEGTVIIGIEIRHPFPADFFFTGFDVRGIVMFDGSNVMPASALVTSDKTLGDCELVNADGFTPIFNTVMYAPGSKPFPIMEYSRGRYASEGGFTGTLNGYKVYYNLLDRHVYSPDSGGIIECEFEIYIPPGEFRFGYAIDASWLPPIGEYPFEDPINDWPPEANQAAAYQVSMYMGELPPLGGNAEILIDVYDWQGPQTIDRVEVESPAYFDGFIEADYLEAGPNYTRYHAYVWNYNSPPGDNAYQVLVRVSDTAIPDSDLGRKAYQIMRVDVPPDEPGQDIIVLADLTAFMLDPFMADNEVYLYNMVSYTPPAGSAVENFKKLLFYEGHGGTMWYNDANTKSIVEAAGYTYIRHSNEPLHATEDEYKVIFIFMPGYHDHTDWFTEPEIEELKTFAEMGGRLIPICERANVMSNKDVFNKLVADLGSGIVGLDVDWNYSITVTQEFIFPDQVTENVHSMYVQWPSALSITPIDKKVFILPDQYNNDIVMARSRIIID